ncbi:MULTISPECIES: RNA 2',3'-cyclic phosphodiesterase [unclassified Chelatococcus]|uniref:RNA 2',3'-cyclic phosphodiesterase n=1 Tax=unclassified Chelatococcus TaxID=2638111 RepID=UPI001BCFD44A|nr:MULTISPECIES: RNA 2',3'-cyclic phosphodiesterase [unclassified Chelatococcus]CAH1658155.1 RNA 2',3'-cyclic phosphodiesterase [Hyphomicrobiales bacterium]MBS7740771.1 RNA 2',3'-cyclic phosphodiesterase [Chelatococcus sp. HY11]MBX3545995.1 RNA 2',3'-cyclic phosphodiesterase [Chelatococcus sp.]MCO5079622.1 RNA 2',3'-cyclic phosphodiesterase [Chelatococcus sp.]CAH1684224.1 RNA 2',3'-cyclic phosphodiesterase [Hyphomicrobiales bacterium]
MPRLFSALSIPEDVAGALSLLRGGLPGARWMEPNDYHLTLRFIGDIDDAMARDIDETLAEIHRRPFDVTIEGLDSFGGARPRAIIARAAPAAPLMELQADLERRCRRAGLDPETRKFTPHVTLARLRDASPLDVADYLSTRSAPRSITFPVDHFVLMSARASVGGGPYITEAVYPLLRASPA